MLVVLNTFLLAMKQNGMNKFFRISLLYITYIALLMTLSLANIIAMFVITMFFFFHDLRKKRFLNPTFIGIPFLIFLFSLTQVTSDLGNTASGENIAAGNSTAERTYWQWYHSPGHHRNMFNPKWSRIGVGYVKIEGSPFVHYWTTDFGY